MLNFLKYSNFSFNISSLLLGSSAFLSRSGLIGTLLNFEKPSHVCLFSVSVLLDSTLAVPNAEPPVLAVSASTCKLILSIF